eukprot:4489107-Pleurochrysis_carterae.AAC.1
MTEHRSTAFSTSFFAAGACILRWLEGSRSHCGRACAPAGLLALVCSKNAVGALDSSRSRSRTHRRAT